MASAAHLAACDFGGATTLVPTNSAANAQGVASYYLPCNLTTPGGSLYLSCSVANHCAAGQRLTVDVSPHYRVFDTDGTVLLHSDSLARVMTLLGHRVDPTTGFAYLERGYQTEADADATMDMIWCLESHCPASAIDWLPTATATECRAEVYNLAGFVSRKRPIPDFAHSEGYYRTALSHEPTHCATLVRDAGIEAAAAPADRCPVLEPACARASRNARA